LDKDADNSANQTRLRSGGATGFIPIDVKSIRDK